MGAHCWRVRPFKGVCSLTAVKVRKMQMGTEFRTQALTLLSHNCLSVAVTVSLRAESP